MEAKDYTEQIKHAVTDQENISILTIIKQALARGITTTIYLCGEGFDGNWFSQSTNVFVLEDECLWENICLHLSGVFVCKQTGREQKVPATQNHTTISQIGLVVHHHGRDMFCPTDHGGKTMGREQR